MGRHTVGLRSNGRGRWDWGQGGRLGRGAKVQRAEHIDQRRWRAEESREAEAVVEEDVPLLSPAPVCVPAPAGWPRFAPGTGPARQEIVRQTQAKQASGKIGQR